MKLYKILCIGVLAALYLIPSQVVAQNGNILLILDDKVNLRAKSNVDSEVTTNLENGEQARIIDQSLFFETVVRKTDYWYKVKVDGKIGWVFGAYTSQKLSANPRILMATYKNTSSDASLHIYFQSQDLKELGWKGHGINTWDFGYADAQNKYSGYKFYTNPNRTGDLTISKYKDVLFEIEWKVAPREAPKNSRELIQKEVPVIVSIKKYKAPKVKTPKLPKSEKENTTGVPGRSF